MQNEIEAEAPTPRALSTRAAAKYIGLSASFLYQASSRGNLRGRTPAPKPVRIGRRLLWLLDDLDAFLERQRDGEAACASSKGRRR